MGFLDEFTKDFKNIVYLLGFSITPCLGLEKKE